MGNFGRGSPKEYFYTFIFKIHPLVKAEKSFEGFFSSIFSSGCHFVQRSETVWTILVEGHLKKHACLICFNILPLVKEKKSFSGFLTAILCNGT